ncbi:O-methyltransferase ZRP4 [Dichanthelium oligosanthes]|uniref:O-methyltransferase ZRP4 n=1 Tax=Dichanthelium oligosanthes TaxID=888268 RepID=A0A1E5UXE0_9POAL|nr:O-methyltransferase ZRP4 [Dichanthelium oligosanthes]
MSSAHQEEVSTQNLHRGYVEIWHQGLFHIKSSALLCAVGLGIPSAIHRRGGAATIPDIGTETGIHPSKLSYLRRFMRMLTFCGIFTTDQPKEGEGETVYKLTPVSQILVEDRASSSASYDMSALLRVIVRPSTAVSTFFSLEEWFRDGSDKTLFEVAHGVHPWTLTKNDPSYNKACNDSMVMDSRILMDIMLKEASVTDVFGGLTSLVDAGGGLGVAAMAITRAFPHIKCTVLDLEQVISQAPSSDGTVQFIVGDMFEYIPPADAVFLKLIMDCWNDDDCVKILRRCKKAIPAREAGGKVIIVNCVLGYGAQDSAVMETQILFDVYMMRYGGAQREEQEWRKIFLEAEFSDYKITPIFGFQSIIEVFP